MLCAISGEAPREPVASRKSGNVFEKRLIAAHMAEHHTDPVTGEELAAEDLIELKAPNVVAPRAPNFTSIPAMLSAFQNEWDALVLETHTLKQHLAQTRQELSTALYTNDAATRVIARLQRERDEARESLASITVTGSAPAGDAMQVDGEELPEELQAVVEDTQKSLYATRRKRTAPADWTSAEDVSNFDIANSTDSLYPGSSSVAMNDADSVLFGGADGTAGVYDLSQAKVTQTFNAGNAVTATAWWEERAVIGTSAGTVKIFEGGNEIAQVGSHAGAVTSVSLHPSGKMLVSAGADKRYAVHDLQTFKTVSQVYVEAEITCTSFHVDGALFFVGSSDGKLRVFDIKTGTVLSEPSTGAPVLDVRFSENGTWFAVVNQGSTTISVWDIRKQVAVHTLEAGSPVTSCRWDHSGMYLAIGASGSVSVQQYTKATKTWAELVQKAVPATDVAWAAKAQSLVALTPEGGLAVLTAS
ncbi:WD40 repeat-like protein [Decorospora gaudefroyi]|uniref:Pre-mRNA-processing factor 19 n=1 Tax=Decorospora gaudefroyi TaxID=184978 RepID=A0A6A5K2J6_9PLEO|nr:WD40 repeat-like protein [Decorospora gaudefroyi]